MNLKKEIEYDKFSKEQFIDRKSLDLPFFERNKGNTKSTIDFFLDNLSKQALKETDGVQLKKLPNVSFAMAYNAESIYLKFYVSEPYFRSEYRNIHDPVSEDSCVELFISFDDNEHYYNLEFNALGTCLAAYGSNRHDREKLPLSIVQNITHSFDWEQYLPEENRYKWRITLFIPLSVFCFSDIKNLRGKKTYANIYKCGEALIEPHYLVWNNIKSGKPDFHQPESFGFLNFL